MVHFKITYTVRKEVINSVHSVITQTKTFNADIPANAENIASVTGNLFNTIADQVKHKYKDNYELCYDKLVITESKLPVNIF